MLQAIVNKKRIRSLNDRSDRNGPIVYAMARDQRIEDNWALLFAQELAFAYKQPLIVACPIAADYPEASQRQRDFMMTGLAEIAHKLKVLNLLFIVSEGSPAENLCTLAHEVSAGAIVCDFNPLRESQEWKKQLAARVTMPIFEVDAHNIVPCWEASDKLEYAAYTIRPKINRKLNEFLTPFPSVKKHPFILGDFSSSAIWSSIDAVTKRISGNDHSMPCEPGEAAAKKHLRNFLSKRLIRYNDLRNDPNQVGQSGLSPYFHFGQLSAQRAALEAQRFDADIASQEAFLEELIIRRELSDNFCCYNDKYNAVEGFPTWAQKTLDEHRHDPRPYLYDRDSLEAADTHDELWNAAQIEMVTTGKMHGYLRMYWAKKILEWTISPEEALTNAIYLNDAHELDGHDPNGFAGIAWSIGGVHDRAWSEREIFGKIRYMSFGGCKRKFNITAYAKQIASIAPGVVA